MSKDIRLVVPTCGAAPPSLMFAIDYVALGVSVLASLSLLTWVLLRCEAGFDFTDEGFYLNWISSPHRYTASLSQFGFVYHPLYQLLGGRVVQLRWVNVLAIFGCAFVLCTILLRSIACARPDRKELPLLQAIPLALAMAAGALTFFDLWIPTPGYNALTFVSLMLCAIGALRTGPNDPKRGVAAWILIGVAGGLTFLAKPTSAAMLGFAVLAYLLIAGRFQFRGLALSVFTAAVFLAICALMIDGSLAGGIDRLLSGLYLLHTLSDSHDALRAMRLDSFHFSDEQEINFLLVLVAALAATTIVMFENAATRLGAALVALVLAVSSISVSTGLVLPAISYEPFQPMLVWAVSIAVAVSVLMFPRFGRTALSRDNVAAVVFFLILPYAFAIGTENNYWRQGAWAGFFWLLCPIVISADIAARKGAWWKLVPVTSAALLVPTIVLSAAMEHPYRQMQPLRLQTVATNLGTKRSSLLLSAETAAYIRDLRLLAEQNGLVPGGPMIDLGGRSPGLVYAIGAQAPGAAWLLGGYAGSNDFFNAALDMADCDMIAAAWILTEPDSPTALPSKLLQRYGIDASRDYREVGSVHAMRGLGTQRSEQRLLKPTRDFSVAKEACEQAKKKLLVK
ncbi:MULTISPECIES: hypothetical protein [unclassified Bradyrhizobium]|uniref:hypothetical protein n=1 Tax=unclassified Bradyrhizobium TaxID=2631580 RepID=UPI00247AED6E|nr:MULTISPECIES: hypothetical protein [unclassified Bradyrhizobium]WGS22840.1 hypothetical protein MTX22_14960 [Bradyrhizobium sp. ISRA463]WGS29831.1 hypothetical protein MTX19_12705 [Bradyrhizobium sp. ISRA464]